MSDHYYKAEDVRSLAFGNWLSIIDALAPQMSHSVDKVGRHTSCPSHGGKDGFRLFKDAHESGGAVCNTCGVFPDGFELLMWANKWDFPDVLFEVGEFLNAPRYTKRSALEKSLQASTSVVPESQIDSSHKDVDPEADARSEKRKQHLEQLAKEQSQRLAKEQEYLKSLEPKQRKLWDSALPITHELAKPAISYLTKRRIFSSKLCHNSIRFVPDLGFHDEDGNLVQSCPAILLAIRDVTGDMQTIHRIYITKSGSKAMASQSKKMMSIPFGKDVCGASIQLTPLGSSGVLSLAEGAETAIAAFRAFGYPSWATVNSVLLERFEPPPGVHTVIVWADKDKSLTGEKSALILKSKLQEKGIKCLIFTPPMPIPKRAKGVDWNDVLVQQGVLGFPRRALFDKALRDEGEGLQCL